MNLQRSRTEVEEEIVMKMDQRLRNLKNSQILAVHFIINCKH